MKTPVSMLSAGVLALTVACSGTGMRAGTRVDNEALESGAFAMPEVAASEAARVEPEPLEPATSAVQLPAAISVATAGATTTDTAALPGRKSPMQALNQMVTAQALLVSLLLAPFSKDGAEAPLARVDATSGTAPTR